MKTGIESNLEQLMPGRVKVDFVEPMAVAIKRTKLRRKLVGVEAKLDGFGLAKLGAQFGQLPFGPACAFAAHRVSQYDVAREHIVRLERRRLVLNVEHRP